MLERVTRAHLVCAALFTRTAVAVLLGGVCAFMLVAGALVEGSQGDSGTNNCCDRADWACSTQNEWDEGYYAFVNGQCAVAQPESVPQEEPSQSATATATAPASVGTSGNCCNNAGWRCTTQTEWDEGYYSARNNTCHLMPTVWAADATPSGQATEESEQTSSRRRSRSRTSSEEEVWNPYADVKVYDQYGNETDDVEVRLPTDQELCDAGLEEFCDEE